MRIGILGGTGPAGSALAARLASIGYEVVIGSRSKYRAMEARDTMVSKWPEIAPLLGFGDNIAAAQCDVVVIATPWDSAATTAQENVEYLRGKVVVSMANALVRVGHEFQPLVPPRGSVAAHVQAAVPQCRVVAAFHHLRRRSRRGRDHQRHRHQDPWVPPARCRRTVERHCHRGLHGGAAATERPVQDPRGS
jgi:NADPH-dependent F420 reductase